MCEPAAFHHVDGMICTEYYRTESLVVFKSVGSIENFWGSYAVVCKMLFDYCMEVMWNAVFYDPVAEYSSAWRKGKLWSGYSLFREPASKCSTYVIKKIEKQPNEAVSY